MLSKQGIAMMVIDLPSTFTRRVSVHYYVFLTMLVVSSKSTDFMVATFQWQTKASSCGISSPRVSIV